MENPAHAPVDTSLVIVDDDGPFLQRLGRAMETRGFEVRTAQTVEEGLALIAEKPPAFACGSTMATASTLSSP
jgi:two-component system response regulator RegA